MEEEINEKERERRGGGRIESMKGRRN